MVRTLVHLIGSYFSPPTSSVTFDVPFTMTTLKHVILWLRFLAVYWDVPVLNLYANIMRLLLLELRRILRKLPECTSNLHLSPVMGVVSL
jgi:hypothetical protein